MNYWLFFLLYGIENDKQNYIDKLKFIYDLTNYRTDLKEEDTIFYDYINNNDILVKNNIGIISQQIITTRRIWNILYSFIFLFYKQTNKQISFIINY